LHWVEQWKDGLFQGERQYHPVEPFS